VQENGLAKTVELVNSHTKSFSGDPRGGPWTSVIRTDADFAKAYAAQDVEAYKLLVAGMARTMFDRDSVPGAEAEDMLRMKTPALVIPGNDPSHATSAARYLQECIPGAEYWDMPVESQTEANTPARVLEFLKKVEG
jgi:hypothetical protein